MKHSTGTVTSSSDNILSAVAGKSFLITGADGFLGARLTKLLIANQASVYGLVRSADHLKRLDKNTKGLLLVGADIGQLDRNRLGKLPRGIDAVIHAAAAGTRQGPSTWDDLMQVNVGGTFALLNLAKDIGARRFVYVGSSFEYGDGNGWEESAAVDPLNVYGVSKYMGWVMVKFFMKEHGLPVVGLRPFYLYGEGEDQQRFVPTVIKALKEQRALPMTLGEQERDFVYVDDAALAVIHAAVIKEAPGELFNIASGKATTMRDAVSQLMRLSGLTIDIQWGALPYRKQEWYHLSGSPAKAARILGFRTSIDLTAGLTKALQCA